VLRKLHEMPGIAKLDLDLGQAPQPAARGTSPQETVLAMLASGPKHRNELKAALDSQQRFYHAVNQLKKKKMIKAVGDGTYALSKHVAQKLNGHAPEAPVKKGPAGRAVRGQTAMVLRSALTGQTLSASQIAEALYAHGMSAKSAPGVLYRAKRDGLVKKDGKGYVLTAKGREADGQ
jgi:hypothetical protein